MKKKRQLTYEDSARKMNTKARDTLLEGVCRDWARAKEEVKGSVKKQLLAINLLRNAGLKLQQACGHEQMTFGFYDSVRTQIPDDMSFQAIKACIHLANKYESEITDLGDVKNEFQLMLTAVGEMKERHRESQQIAHFYNPWDELASKCSKITTLFKEIKIESMEQWDNGQLEAFIRDTGPIVEKHEAAKRLAAGGAK